jgi:hypothetical protein
VGISWPGPSTAGGPQVRLYATAVECSQFRAPPAENSGACAVLATGGWNNGFVSSLILTHGRGNPETLGSPPAYKLWVVGDSVQATRYTISITWFYGPDC